MSIWVCGEVLIDLLPVGPVVGGGPANTARALARLGNDVEFIDGISSDEYGVSARKTLLRDGVKLSHVHTSEKPTCTAKVTLDKSGAASYEFLIEATATFDFSPAWLPDPSRHKPNLLHIGTLATIVEPGCSHAFQWALDVAEFAPIVFDPNIRPSVINDRDTYVASVEKWAAISTVVKLSDEDLGWLYPGQDLIDVARRWVGDGVAIVVITKGATGLVAITADEMVEVNGVTTKVIDTVGAGDTVGAVIVDAIAKNGVLNLHGEALRSLLDCAAVAAAITCSRAGAQPPTQYELADALEGRK
ncbi:MAG: carbohydrate kinase [Actinomycetes bacterium]|nr:carbohydrate kinase [Actinomycetota bacterium]